MVMVWEEKQIPLSEILVTHHGLNIIQPCTNSSMDERTTGHRQRRYSQPDGDGEERKHPRSSSHGSDTEKKLKVLFHTIHRKTLRSLVLGFLAYDLHDEDSDNWNYIYAPNGSGTYVIATSIKGRHQSFPSRYEIKELSILIEKYAVACTLWAKIKDSYGQASQVSQEEEELLKKAMMIDNQLLRKKNQERSDGDRFREPRCWSGRNAHASLHSSYGIEADGSVSMVMVWEEEQIPLSEILVTVLAQSLVTHHGLNIIQPGTNSSMDERTTNHHQSVIEDTWAALDRLNTECLSAGQLPGAIRSGLAAKRRYSQLSDNVEHHSSITPARQCSPESVRQDAAIAFTDVEDEDDRGREIEEILFGEKNFGAIENDGGISGLEEDVLLDGADDNNDAADFSDEDFTDKSAIDSQSEDEEPQKSNNGSSGKATPAQKQQKQNTL
ncbi:hypothetical protein DL771_010211 [Monosporascus sp. 5C6A]|nr:hypothetical protein DL771_010211 [Monosporascus sp. 5C6A]